MQAEGGLRALGLSCRHMLEVENPSLMPPGALAFHRFVKENRTGEPAVGSVFVAMYLGSSNGERWMTTFW